jgi:hypothetical protein
MKKSLFFLLIPFAAILVFSSYSGAASVSVITKETLKNWMDEGGVTILDARQGRDWGSSEFKIKEAHRADPGQFMAWKDTYPKDQKLVIYCA